MVKIIRKLSCVLGIAVMLTVISGAFSVTAGAEEKKVYIDGIMYEFSEKSEYEIDSSVPSDTVDEDLSLGNLSISGNIQRKYDKDGIAAYEIADGEVFSLDFRYIYTLKNAGKDYWHLIEDGGDVVNGIVLSDDIAYGALIFQTSLDGEKWVDSKKYVNLTSDKSFGNNQINDVQLANGCYYRVIVAFETEKRTNNYSWSLNEFYKMDDYSTKKIAQVYKFYASYQDIIDSEPTGEKYYFYAGAKNSAYTVKTMENNYSGSQTIDKKDPHYGWDLGYFCLSGYTDKGDTDDVYLKKVGNKVKLTFHLDQNINKLNGNKSLKITNDKNGSDEKFKIPSHNMKHGELIIRHTNSENVTEEVKYSDYLAALAYPGADTSIQLFEEGDYEVHLNYAITDYDSFVKSTTYYQTSFKFRIRNANCMVYVFDSKSGAEISNGDVTANGFRIDTAKSSYPKLQVKKEILNNTKNGLVEDTRFNGAASDGELFTDEGIYTIKAFNRYDDKLEPAVKIIYVGNNNILTAYTKHLNTSEQYSIDQLNNMIDDGYTITKNGQIIAPVIVTTTAVSTTTVRTEITTTKVVTTTTTIALTTEMTTTEVMSDTTTAVKKDNNKTALPIVAICTGALAVGSIVVFISKKKKDE